MRVLSPYPGESVSLKTFKLDNLAKTRVHYQICHPDNVWILNHWYSN